MSATRPRRDTRSQSPAVSGRRRGADYRDVLPLDEFQSAAVDHDRGPAIVLAGPGSGKTRVIVERAVRLIDQGRAQPDQILILTFSRKAATDLRERVAARLQRSYASFPITTFHGFCFSL